MKNRIIEEYTQVLRDSESGVEAFMAALEAILISVIGRIGVWLTPLPSAILVARAAERVFVLDGAMPWLMAGVVELVGLVTSAQWLNAQEWNRNKNKSDPEANELLAFGLMIAYFITTAAMLLAFEIPTIMATGNLTGLTALLFPCLSAVGIITLNERMLQHKRTSAKAEVRARKRNEAAHRPVQKTEQPEPEHVAEHDRTGGMTRDRARAILAERPGISGAELGRQIGRSERLGRRLKAELSGENGTETEQ